MGYSFLLKFQFYVAFIFYKFFAPFECYNYRLKVFLNELIFSLHTLGIYKNLRSDSKEKLILKTKLGNFFIRNIYIDFLIASPAFERLDIDELLYKIQQSLNQNHEVIFVDIGAGIGKYTVCVALHFKNYQDKIKIYSFEPDQESFDLLKQNISINKLKNVKIFQHAISNKKSVQTFFFYAPMRMIVTFKTSITLRIKTNTLDHFKILTNKKNDVDLFMKIDVEGHELEVLEGAKKTVQNASTTTILIEDSWEEKKNALWNYLRSHGKLITKKTPYNSFWKIS